MGRRNECIVQINDGQEILESAHFHYLGSIIHHDSRIEKDVNHRIKTRSVK